MADFVTLSAKLLGQVPSVDKCCNGDIAELIALVRKSVDGDKDLSLAVRKWMVAGKTQQQGNYPKFRETGDKNFMEKNFAQALANYRLALLAFPGAYWREGRDLQDVVQTIGNISSVFFAQKKYFQAYCYIELLLSIGGQSLIQEKLDKYKERLEKCKKHIRTEAEHGIGNDTKGENDTVKIGYSKEAGRYAVAARNIEVGEIIIADHPTATSLRLNISSHYCYHCLTLLSSGRTIQSPIAEDVLFCSSQCLTEAFKSYLFYESKLDWRRVFPQKDLYPNQFLLPLRLILVQGANVRATTEGPKNYGTNMRLKGEWKICYKQ